MSINNKSVTVKTWGCEEVCLFTLTNPAGMSLVISNFGAALVSCNAPDRRGHFDDVLLGYDSLQEYMKDEYYIGTVVGRYANRIRNAKVDIEGKEYVLTSNRNGFHHHGGSEGFNKKVFAAKTFQWNDRRGVRLTYISADGEEGYPGNLLLEVIYTLDNENTLSIEYHATTDKATIINVTQHAYFNLAGHSSGDVEAQYVQLFADEWLVTDEAFIPTGEKRTVEGTPFDFRQPVRLKDRVDASVFENGSGYDNTWILSDGSVLKHAAHAFDIQRGRVLDVYTTEPSVHFYSGNFIGDGLCGKNDAVYNRRSGFCLETQHFPDSPHHAHFPSTALLPGEEFYSKTAFKFSSK